MLAATNPLVVVGGESFFGYLGGYLLNSWNIYFLERKKV